MSRCLVRIVRSLLVVVPECSVWPLAVVVGDEDAQRLLEVAAAEDEEPVEAFGATVRNERSG